jgi:GT2 family glycosyltransferase
MNKSTKLPVVILNWNSFKDTKECINSVLEENTEKVKIYLLDNGSVKKEVETIKADFANHPKIKIIFNPSNLGFTKAHNLILKELMKDGNKYIFLLNNDTVVRKESIDFLENYLKKGKADTLTCKIINYWNHDLMDNAGHKMISTGEIIPIGHYESIDNYSVSFENIAACAGAALYSTEMLKDIGLFDEYFITGYEDAELGLRAFIAGYKCLYEPKAIVYHKMGQSVKKIFNYNYVLKTQTNIHYTYIKLVHWQVIAINLIPNIVRFLIITLINIFFLRWRYFRIQYHALYKIFFKDWIRVMNARKESKRLRRIPWWKLFLKQEFFLKRDIKNFYKFIIKGEKSYFEK